MTRGLLTLVLCGVTVAAAGHLGAARQQAYDFSGIPSAALVRATSLGHSTLAANLYWLRVVQYVGDPGANTRGWEQLYPALDLITDLDPRHDYAYLIGGVLLGSFGRVAESNAILEKGIRSVPSKYMLPLLRGYNAFAYDGDYALAGQYMELAARTPGAPPHITQNALAMYVKGSRAEAAITFLSQLLSETTSPQMRAELERQLQLARLEHVAGEVDAAIRAYVSRYGVRPATIAQLVAEGLLADVPADPFGGMLVVGSDGRAHSSVNDFRFKLPEPVGQEPGLPHGGAH